MEQVAFVVIRAVIGLIGMALGSGLTFLTLIHPKGSRFNVYFSVFALSLLVYYSLIFMRAVPGLLPAEMQFPVLQLTGTIICIAVLAYFAFVVKFTSNTTLVARVFLLTIIGMIPFAVWMLGTNQIFQNVSDDTRYYELTIAGQALLAVAVLYGLVAVLQLFQSEDRRAIWLRIPSIFLLLGYVAELIWTTYPISSMLFIVSLTWSAWAVIHAQIFYPMQEMNDQLREANVRLEETAAQMHREKLRVELLNKELQAVDRYKTNFMAAMSHELRTPLNSIVGYSELLLSAVYGDLNSFQSDRLNRILRNSIHLAGLINAVLDLSNLETGKLEIARAPVNLEQVVREVADQLQPVAEKKSIHIAVQSAEPIQVTVDRLRIYQALFNVVENAVKFTHEGQVTIKLFTRADEHTRDGVAAGQQWVIICVQDTGIGIPRESLERIFVSFAQQDNSSTREYGGLGLGLAISKRLVDMHGGRIWAESDEGTGSRFYIALPADGEK
jgi:signal transduction histidine kinase